MDYGHFTYSMLNIIGYMVVGALLAYFVKRDWRKIKDVPSRKFIIVAATAAVTGGMLGVLVNGLSDLSMSMSNIFIASIFALMTIVPYSLSNKIKV